jgi:uncharacterized membrane protein (UPF0136 family)
MNRKDIGSMPPHYLTWLGAGIATFGYGVLALSGGIQGYVRKGSMPSLIAGGISGIVLIVCAVGDWFQLWYAAVVAILVSVLLIGRFAGTLARENRVSGGVLVTPLGKIAVAVVLLGICTILLNAIALTV